MYMRNVCLRILTLAIGLLAFAAGSHRLHGQQYVELIKFTNTWRYNQSGANLGTTWIPSAYDDINSPGWQGGPALLALETIPLPGNYLEATMAGGAIPTPLSLTGGGGTNGTNVTFYFRTKFTNTLASLNAVELWATNLVDDGCVIYLNGVRVGDVRLTNANPHYLMLANGGPGAEGQFDTLSIPANRLIATPNSVNTMAVEVHQSAVNSSDIAFAMRLVAIIATPLTITTQPQNIAAIVGDTAVFDIGVSGGPASYRWFRTGFPNILSTSNTLSFANVQLGLSGSSYYCVVTNSVTTPRTSSVVTLSVSQDLFGPEPISAVVLETAATNVIDVRFDEGLLNSSVNLDTNNFRIFVSGTTNQTIGVTSVQLSGPSAIVRVATNNWALGSNYYIVVNNIMDTRGNRIAPNTVVGVSWNFTVPMTQMNDAWRYYDCGDPTFCDPDSAAVYANHAWAQTNFVPSDFTWGTGPGIFARESGIPSFLCAGDQLNTTLSFQTLPTLFRRTFQLAPSYGTSGTLRTRFIVDDGMVLFLNGREIYRWNVSPNSSPGPNVTVSSRAFTNIAGAFCVTNISIPVTNLLPGMNWLAAAVLQHVTDDGDTVFGMEMDGTFRRTSPIPTLPPTNQWNLLRLTTSTNNLPSNVARFSWPVSLTATTGFYGVHLVWGSNGGTRITNTIIAPNYNQVTNQSNPYFYTNNPAVGGARMFRLWKPGA